jgi:hypothetical protein
VRSPDGRYQVTARYLVGCDGTQSKVRDGAGIPFPGTTYPEVNQLAQVAVPGSVTQLDNGDLDVPGLGRIQPGFTRTDHGVFAFGRLASGALLIQTTEDEAAGADTDAPMTLTEFRDSIRRVLGADLPLGEATRLSRYGSQAQPSRRVAALIAGTDIRYPMPGPGQHDLAGPFAPDLTLHTSQDTTSVAELMHTARPVFLDLADRLDLRQTAHDWRHRVDIRTARTDHPPADAVLIRPDACIAWAAATGEPAGTAEPALREALSGWFGTPLKTAGPGAGGRRECRTPE